MKKYIPLLIIYFFVNISPVNAATLNFNIDPSKLSKSITSKQTSIIEKFSTKYQINTTTTQKNKEIEETIKQQTKKTTNLLLGDFNSQNETVQEYYNRHKEYKKQAVYNYFPKDKTTKSGYDETNPLYKYAVVSELTVPQLFITFNELGINYNSYGDIKVTISDDIVISTILLKDVTIKQEDKNNPMNYTTKKTNLIIYYYFIEIDKTYRLANLYGETTDNINKYFNQIENNETKTKAITTSYDSNLSNIYNFDKLKTLSEEKINKIYKENQKNIVYLRAYYNNKVISNANGIIINDGIVLTTWSFIEKSLKDSQYITIKDNTSTNYTIDGIVTADIETDIALIKLKEKTQTHVKIGNKNNIKIEEPAITLSSKSGTGLTIQKGIIIAIDEYIHTSIPLSQTDEGSPVFDKEGNLIGINTSKSLDTNISTAISQDTIKEIQNKFNTIDFQTIQTITIEELKNKYYYTNYSKENITNNITKKTWDKYKKIGSLEETIKLELVKANYKEQILSLRYKNNIKDYITSMQLATTFKKQLKKEGYKEKTTSSSKCIYENKNYQITIMDEFDYLIIVMVKI